MERLCNDFATFLVQTAFSDVMLRVEQMMLMANAKEKSIFEIPLDAAEEARLDALADAEIDAGSGVDHKKVREWLLQLAKGRKVPPPAA
jgi:hypothetical protein